MRLFVNLKRFDVPRKFGGISEVDNPEEWSRQIIERSASTGVYDLSRLSVVVLFPEAALAVARRTVDLVGRRTASVEIGCQSVFRDDVLPGGNFGAFTSNLPASAAVALGCTWAMIGHSEERRDKQGVIAAYDHLVETDAGRARLGREAVDRLIGAEADRAAERGLKLLLCVGETVEERGDAPPDVVTSSVEERLAGQLDSALPTHATLQGEMVVAYEPVWAIGPGKTPPPPEYIDKVAVFIREYVRERRGFAPSVVYGGGLKRENARTIGAIPAIDGGLVALTRFTGQIGFYPEELAEIAKEFLAGEASRTGAHE